MTDLYKASRGSCRLKISGGCEVAAPRAPVRIESDIDVSGSFLLGFSNRFSWIVLVGCMLHW